MKKLLVLVCSISVSFTLTAQTLFTYGTKQVSKSEFLKAYNKNPDSTGNTAEKMKQYLDMYVNFKLKIQAAYDVKLNADPNFKAEADNFKSQLAENIINEQADINGIVKQAFTRSQKDIMLSHVFVALNAGEDTAAAFAAIQKAYNELQSGKDFNEVATAYSTDSATKANKGFIGAITVFSLPYNMENIVYKLSPGSYSPVTKSSIGYHIFKNMSERPAAGTRKIQQLLFATHESFTAEEKEASHKAADSVYKLLASGASFEKFNAQFGSPSQANAADGTTEVSVGQYTTEFENEVFALSNAGDFSKVFRTDYGYNIIRLVAKNAVVADENDFMNNAHLQEAITTDRRLDASKEALIDKWMIQTKFTPAAFSMKDLGLYTDTAMKTRNKITLPVYKSITPKTVLFSFEKEKVTTDKWIAWLKNAGAENEPALKTTFAELYKTFQRQSCEAYYRQHIEDYYPTIKDQLYEFNEANLLFSVMDKNVWSKAAQDTTGLKKYYAAHKTEYKWQPGVSALIVSAADKKLIDDLAAAVKNNPADWRNIINDDVDDAVADSSRFENGQLPVKQAVPMQKGFISATELNDGGDTYTFAYVFDVFETPGQRSFDDARGMVINDYQQVLEQKWITALRTKYPVKVNDAVLKSILP